jgi:hypothetical protein
VPSDPPIACSLSADELPPRLDAIGEIGRTSLLAVEHAGGRAELRFRPAARDAIAAIVAAEAECCAFLSMELRDEPEALVLTIGAPKGSEPVLHELVGAFSAHRRRGHVLPRIA